MTKRDLIEAMAPFDDDCKVVFNDGGDLIDLDFAGDLEDHQAEEGVKTLIVLYN